jgi:hypothetical protein
MPGCDTTALPRVVCWNEQIRNRRRTFCFSRYRHESLDRNRVLCCTAIAQLDLSSAWADLISVRAGTGPGSQRRIALGRAVFRFLATEQRMLERKMWQRLRQQELSSWTCLLVVQGVTALTGESASVRWKSAKIEFSRHHASVCECLTQQFSGHGVCEDVWECAICVLEKRTHPIEKCGPMSAGADGDAAWPFPARRIASDCNFQAGKRR